MPPGGVHLACGVALARWALPAAPRVVPVRHGAALRTAVVFGSIVPVRPRRSFRFVPSCRARRVLCGACGACVRCGARPAPHARTHAPACYAARAPGAPVALGHTHARASAHFRF
jgi:hypothetical protein